MSDNRFPPRPHLTTPRLTLNALTPADCGDYAALCRDPIPALQYFMDHFLEGFSLTLDELS